MKHLFKKMLVGAFWGIVLLTVLLPATPRLNSREVNSRPKTHRDLLKQIEAEGIPEYLVRGSNGEIISITLLGNLINDENLNILSALDSVKTVGIQGGPSADFTAKGIASLKALTNLFSLKVSCVGKLPVGAFIEICGLTRLQELDFVASYAPRNEYSSITNLQNLMYLDVAYCTNFGDPEVKFLADLGKLKTLILNSNDVSTDGTNALSSLTSLTNVVFKVRRG